MKFTVEKQNIVKIISVLSNIAIPKSLATTSKILIETNKENQISLFATDLEISVKSFVPAKIEQEGACAIDAKKLNQIIHELPLDNLNFYQEDGNLIIESGYTVYKIGFTKKEEMPTFPEYEESFRISLPQKTFKKMLNKSVYAASKEISGKYVLTGVLLEINKDSIKMVATDSHRLTYMEEKISSKKEKYCIIPARSLLRLKDLLSDTPEDKIDIIFSEKERNIIFNLPNSEVIVRLLEGEFPDYKKVIPHSFSFGVELPKDKIIESTTRVSIISSEKIRPPVKYDFKGNRLIINSSAPELGEAKDEVILPNEIVDFEISFNANFVIEALRNMETENIKLQGNNKSSPALLKETEGEHFCLIMPMKTI